MGEHYDALYLSPHLDDAALSCGGQIAARTRAGERVLVVTLFAGDAPEKPWSELIDFVHGLFELGDGAVAVRRAEDREACTHLSAEHLHLDLHEAIYRRRADGEGFLYDNVGELFGRQLEEDNAVFEDLVSALTTLPPALRVISPLAVGRHVDHLVTRTAAEQVFESLAYYEDIPYAEKWRAVNKTLGNRSGWQSQTVPLEPADLDAKVAAIAAYVTQLDPLYGNAQRMSKSIRRRAGKLGGERLWTRVES